MEINKKERKEWEGEGRKEKRGEGRKGKQSCRDRKVYAGKKGWSHYLQTQFRNSGPSHPILPREPPGKAYEESREAPKGDILDSGSSRSESQVPHPWNGDRRLTPAGAEPKCTSKRQAPLPFLSKHTAQTETHKAEKSAQFQWARTKPQSRNGAWKVGSTS